MASVALVLSILVPSVGNAWYGLTALSPLAALYYFSRGERVEQVCCVVGLFWCLLSSFVGLFTLDGAHTLLLAPHPKQPQKNNQKK